MIKFLSSFLLFVFLYSQDIQTEIINNAKKNNNIDEKGKLDYYIEYLKTNTDIRWKSVLIVTMDITILSFIVSFIYKITDLNHFQDNNFILSIFIIIIIFIFAFNYFGFRYIWEEAKKIKLLEKLFKDK